MKTASSLISSFLLATLSGSLYAVTEPYHVHEGYFGETSISVTGSCHFAPLRYNSTWFGEVFDINEVSQGWGIITASGDPVVWEEDYAPVLYKENNDTGVGQDTSYTNMVGVELYDMISTYAGCSIQVLEPDQAARSTMKWDKFRGKDNIKINARFGGFEKSICRDTASGKRCQAGSFTGSVKFNGRYSVPD